MSTPGGHGFRAGDDATLRGCLTGAPDDVLQARYAAIRARIRKQRRARTLHVIGVATLLLGLYGAVALVVWQVALLLPGHGWQP